MRPILMSMIHLFVACLLALTWPLAVAAHPGAHEAVVHFSELIEQNPQRQSLYIERGIAYSNDGQYAEALADFQRATTLGEPVVVSFDIGVVYYRMGEFATARRYFDEFLARFPEHTACLEYRARLARDAGDYESAVADFKRIFALQDNSNPGHYISAARMLTTNPVQGVDAALDLLDQGMGQLGVVAQLQEYAIQLESQRGNYTAALTRLETLQPALGTSPDWLADMGAMLALLGRPVESREWYLAADRQLQLLRKTPARLALQQQVDQALKGH